jgi:hypothetical protein
MLTVELSPATRFDRVQLFTVDSARLMFTGGGFGGRGRGGRGAGRGETPGAGPAATETASAAATNAAPAAPRIDSYQYKIEGSLDGNTYTALLDQSTNTVVRNTLFDEFPPTKCRFVRLTMVNWPRTSPLGIIEFTVFGKPAESLPAAVAIPELP